VNYLHGTKPLPCCGKLRKGYLHSGIASIERPIRILLSLSTAEECYPCRKVTLNYNRSFLFHGGDAGSLLWAATLQRLPILISNCNRNRVCDMTSPDGFHTLVILRLIVIGEEVSSRSRQSSFVRLSLNSPESEVLGFRVANLWTELTAHDL